MKKATTLLLGLTLSFAAIAQTFNVGGPVSFNSHLLSNDSKMNEYVMPVFDLEKQLDDNLINQQIYFNLQNLINRIFV